MTRIDDELRRAVDAGEITAAFQPQVDLRSGRIVGAEVLARWTHPRRGEVAPREFIPVAEECGVIHELGMRMLEAGWRAAREWTARGHRLEVSINVSAVQLEREDFVDAVAELLDSGELPPESLTLEITESRSFDDPAAVGARLALLRHHGAGVSIDDFGTGHSSRRRVDELPVTEVKLATAMVRDDSPAGEAAVAEIVALAHGRGIRVVAEGLEHPAQRERVAAAGCDRGQGYLFARPVPSAEFLDLAG